jgi:hypothetical protein
MNSDNSHDKPGTERHSRVVNTPTPYSGGSVFKSRPRRLAILIEVFRGFPVLRQCRDIALKELRKTTKIARHYGICGKGAPCLIMSLDHCMVLI